MSARLGLVADAQGLTNTPSRPQRGGRFETEQAEGLRRATMNKQLTQELWDANARIESMIHIGGMAADGDSLPNVLEDLLQEDDETLAHAFPDMPAWVKEVLDDRHERGPAFSEWVHRSGKLGFVVQFATPVMSNVDEHGGGTYSWGHYYTRWTYGETLEEAASNALAWVAERRAHERQKQRTEAVEA